MRRRRRDSCPGGGGVLAAAPAVVAHAATSRTNGYQRTATIGAFLGDLVSDSSRSLATVIVIALRMPAAATSGRTRTAHRAGQTGTLSRWPWITSWTSLP